MAVIFMIADLDTGSYMQEIGLKKQENYLYVSDTIGQF